MPKDEWAKFGPYGRQDTPPPKFKQHVVSQYQKQYGCRILVETGTYRGDMVAAQLNNFDKIYTIELGRKLWRAARRRFDGHLNVHVLFGDSGRILEWIMDELAEPAIFWLDAHYSGGKTARGDKQTPIFNELDTILRMPDIPHVILIDDARSFNGTNDFPTLHDLERYVRKYRPEGSFTVEDDIIRSVL